MAKETNRKRAGRLSWWLLPAAVLLIWALAGIWSGPDLMQYAVVPPETENVQPESASGDSEMERSSGEKTPEASAERSSGEQILEKYNAFLAAEIWSGSPPMTAVHGEKRDQTVSLDSGTTVSDVTLKLVGPRYFEVCPVRMKAGETLSPMDLREGFPSVVLDSEAAFKLFGGDASPVGKKVKINGEEFTVRGIAEHSRSFGAVNLYTAWAPMGACGTLKPECWVLSSPRDGGEGFSVLWKNQAKESFGEGTWTDLNREKTRATLSLRLLAVLAACALLKKWFACLKRWGERFLAQARERRAREYASRMIGFYLLRILLGLVLTAATLGALSALTVFAARPLLLFPEWVPENPAALSSILSRFWSLTAEAAEPVRLSTEATASLRFYAFLLRVGTLMLLIGCIQTLRIQKGLPKGEDR